MSIVDYESTFQVDFPRKVVFDTAIGALKSNRQFQVTETDPVLHTINLKAGMSLFSWGENIKITVNERGERSSEIAILSTPVTGAFMMDMGKNRRNIDNVMKCISHALQNLKPTPPAPPSPPQQSSGISSPTQETQAFEFTCPHCKVGLECPLEVEGTRCQCPQCGQEIYPSRNM